jgi:hypothetical protein
MANAALALPAPELQGADKSATRLGAVADSAPPPNDPKAAASPRAPAGKPIERQQASKQPTKGQESPVAKATHPMATRTRTASGAGSLRSGVGSGSTGYVCDKLSPSSKPGS